MILNYVYVQRKLAIARLFIALNHILCNMMSTEEIRLFMLLSGNADMIMKIIGYIVSMIVEPHPAIE